MSKKTKKVYCIPCELNSNKVEATEIINGIPLCAKHVKIQNIEFKDVDNF